MKECCDVLCHNYVDPASIYQILPQISDPAPDTLDFIGSTKFTGYPAVSGSGGDSSSNSMSSVIMVIILRKITRYKIAHLSVLKYLFSVFNIFCSFKSVEMNFDTVLLYVAVDCGTVV